MMHRYHAVVPLLVATALVWATGCAGAPVDEETKAPPAEESAEGPTQSVAQEMRKNCTLSQVVKCANACPSGPGVTACIENCWLFYDLCNGN